MKVTAQSYGQFLVNSPVNFTGTYFADTVDELEHDSVYRFLKNSRLTPALLREKMSDIVAYSPHGRILFDDTVLDKNSSHKIEGAVAQYLRQRSSCGHRYWRCHLRILQPHYR